MIQINFCNSFELLIQSAPVAVLKEIEELVFENSQVVKILFLIFLYLIFLLQLETKIEV